MTMVLESIALDFREGSVSKLREREIEKGVGGNK